MSKSKITRRDFINGMAVSVAAGMTFSPRDLWAGDNVSPPEIGVNYYPPALTGMRGHHPGAFDVSHAMGWQGKRWALPAQQTDEIYDLVVVGGGISGLSAAWYYRKENPKARILVLDNHDDFGGHGKRLEFDVDGKKLISWGGSMTILGGVKGSPGPTRELMEDIGIEDKIFQKGSDQTFFKQHSMGRKLYFDKEHYQKDVVVPEPYYLEEGLLEAIEAFPFSDEDKAQVLEIMTGGIDYLASKKGDDKYNYLASTDYLSYLHDDVKAPQSLIELLRKTFLPALLGFSWEALPALVPAMLYMPGTMFLGLDQQKVGEYLYQLFGDQAANLADFATLADGSTTYNFPDGNAGIARLLVRKLIPAALPGVDVESSVMTPVNYDMLDHPENLARVRLNSTAVDVRHTDNKQEVDITYVQHDKPYRVRAKHTVLACFNASIPYMCPELSDKQAQALKQAVRVPMVDVKLALKRWTPFAEKGIESFHAPKAMYTNGILDYPMNIGGWEFAKTPTDPIVMQMQFIPATAMDISDGNLRNTLRAARHQIYAMSFDDFEQGAYKQLSGLLAGTDFDPAKDVAAITVNRWSHGPAYMPMPLTDSYFSTDSDAPNIVGRNQHHRISIANSDAGGLATMQSAMLEAHRAIQEQLAIATS